MNLMDDGFSWVWSLSGFVLLLASLSWAVRTAPWYKLKDKESQHVFLGTTFIVFLFWHYGASIGGGLTFHFLLSAVTTLMFGAQFAIFATVIALFGVTLLDGAGWSVFGLNAMIMGVVPVMIVWWIAVWAYRHMERNFFVFILLNGFLAAGISSLVSFGLAAWVMWASGAQLLEKLQQSFIPYIPLIVVPEGFVNGMILLALVLMKPQWVSCFTDEQYLDGK